MKTAIAVILLLIGGPVAAQDAQESLRRQFGPFVGSHQSWGAFAYCSGFLSVLEVEDPALQRTIKAEAESLFQRSASIDGTVRAEDIRTRVTAHWQTQEDSPQARIDMGVVLQHCLGFAANPDLRQEFDLMIR